VDLSSADINRYIAHRKAEGAANGTINRELSVLRRMFSLALDAEKLHRAPRIKRLVENNTRTGFFEQDQFEAVCRHLPHDLQVAVAIEYTYGWRTQSEVLTLERRQLDLGQGTLRLDPGTTKNRDGRVVSLTPLLAGLLRQQVDRVQALEQQLGRDIPYLFPHLTARRAGTRRKDFRKAWATACKRAGVGHRIRHDFRRTAVRNMVRAGIPEKTAMLMSGHRTRTVFDRYNIVNEQDLRDAAAKLAGQSIGQSTELTLLTPAPNSATILVWADSSAGRAQPLQG
jgi:integrase